MPHMPIHEVWRDSPSKVKEKLPTCWKLCKPTRAYTLEEIIDMHMYLYQHGHTEEGGLQNQYFDKYDDPYRQALWAIYCDISYKTS